MAKAILIADDNAVVRKLLCHLFEFDDDYKVCAEATNGQEAIALALQLRPDLIVLDLSMPVMNGADAARQLKTMLPTIPIILFTHYANLGNHLRGPDMPVDRIVSKGDARDLIRHVRELIPA
jgi:CheY-like chemotaxis protein